MNDGGPAFPCEISVHPIGQVGYSEKVSGMSLRDYFAAKALQAIIKASMTWQTDGQARQAYEYADAMLRHREKQG